MAMKKHGNLIKGVWVPSALLKDRASLWGGVLPGLHIEFASNCFTCIFDGHSVAINIEDIDPSNVYESVKCAFRDGLHSIFIDILLVSRSVGSAGNATDCEQMADKVAAKCARLNIFAAWLVLAS